MQGIDGIELCARMVREFPGLPIVVMTAFGSMDTAVAAMRAGAADFLTKPLELGALASVLGRALARREPSPERAPPPALGEPAPLELVALEEVERRYILRVLEAVRGNKSRAAQVLGLDRKTLYRRLERYAAASSDPGAASVAP
jgi:DNA-binding NtrC family response regulator